VNRKFVTVEVKYDTEETWVKSLLEIKEVFLLMNNITRNASIVSIENGVNE
jgi:hypothetical protein|tara:strand:+ start:386 stop:538 length:153 start_codon:yes stop_codon:yes gene_type:complete